VSRWPTRSTRDPASALAANPPPLLTSSPTPAAPCRVNPGQPGLIRRDRCTRRGLRQYCGYFGFYSNPSQKHLLLLSNATTPSLYSHSPPSPPLYSQGPMHEARITTILLLLRFLSQTITPLLSCVCVICFSLNRNTSFSYLNTRFSNVNAPSSFVFTGANARGAAYDDT